VTDLTQTPDAEPDQTPTLLLTVIIPARNEAASLPACLQSLVTQSEPGFELGTEWELLVVDDHSTDATASIAAEFPGVTLLQAPTLDQSGRGNPTGKNNACWAGAQAAQGQLLLFTDADTIHEPGSLSRARRELEKYEVSMLSYSPRQLTSGFWQRVLMPLVFAELAIAYPPKQVNDPANRVAAANGQFLLVQQEDYFTLGGHRAVGPLVLEDVALAHNFKRSKRGLRFRYAPDALVTRMYRTTEDMIEGWTKNLALLFPSPIPLALLRLLDLVLFLGLPALALYPFFTSLQRGLILLVWARVLWRIYARAAKSNFPVVDCILSVLGLPLFIGLLVRSYVQVKVRKSVAWKGRSYPIVNK
jgi:glycosyltransferase involved in cell wall biosynthesis